MEHSRNWTEINVHKFDTDTTPDTKGLEEGSHEVTTPRLGAAPLSPCQGVAWAPRAPPDAALWTVYSPCPENPKDPINYP